MKTIVITVLGNNRSSEFITEAEFDLSPFKKYDIFYSNKVTPRERNHSSLFYEVLSGFDAIIEDPNDVHFIFARGCIGNNTEIQIIKQLVKKGIDIVNSKIIVIAKSFGVVDFLRTKYFLSDIPINTAFFIDGNATTYSKRSVSKRYKIGRSKKRRFVIPSNIKKVYNIIQRTAGFEGLYCGAVHDDRISNIVIKPNMVDGLKYCNYKDSHCVDLEVHHKHMDEIAMVLPLYDGKVFKDFIKTI